MPKRHKHLFEQVVSLENLFAAAHKAMRGKRGKIPVARCFGELEKAVVGVRDDLVAGTWQPGEYFYFGLPEKVEVLDSAIGTVGIMGRGTERVSLFARR